MTGPIATPSPEKPAHTAIARPRSRGSRKTLARIDSVAGMISAPPMPMNARLSVSCSVDVERAADTDPATNTTRPTCSAPLRPKRSLRLPVGEQEAGEHQRVGVDDPLDLAVRGAEVLDHRRDRHVEDRVVERDDQQRHAQHAERPPPSGVDVIGDLRFQGHRGRRRHRSLVLSGRPAPFAKRKGPVS